MRANNPIIYNKTIERDGHRYVVFTGPECIDGSPCFVQIEHSPDCSCRLEGINVSVVGPGIKGDDRLWADIRALKTAYDGSFPQEEREDYDRMILRLRGEIKGTLFSLYAAACSDAGVPVGVLFAEHYYRSNCILMTYCLVAPRLRRNGRRYSGHLLRDGLGTIINAVARETAGNGPEAVFFESEDPARTTPTALPVYAMDPASRLQWVKAIGGSRIGIRYIQPQLEANRGAAENLDLYYLPADGAGIPTMETVTLFIDDYFDILAKSSHIAPKTIQGYKEIMFGGHE